MNILLTMLLIKLLLALFLLLLTSFYWYLLFYYYFKHLHSDSYITLYTLIIWIEMWLISSIYDRHFVFSLSYILTDHCALYVGWFLLGCLSFTRTLTRILVKTWTLTGGEMWVETVRKSRPWGILTDLQTWTWAMLLRLRMTHWNAKDSPRSPIQRSGKSNRCMAIYDMIWN